MTKRLAVVLLMGLAATVLFAPAASAHGERSQEAFLRMRTVGWTDVVFSGGERDAEGDIVIAQGEKVRLQGMARLMETWPDTLAAGEPEVGYVNIATQGPVVGMLERTVNGVSTPGRIEVAKGNTYEFDMLLMGRRVGRWHVHPTFSVKGAGTVVGPGEWIEVTKSEGGFTSPVKLYNGDTINLENYYLNMVWIFQVVGFILGVIWVVWWTGGSMIGRPKWGPKWHRTVTNPAVTLQIPLNDDGVAVGLNRKADHRFVNIMVLATSIFLLGGWVYQAAAFPVKIPQQVVQFEPPPIAADAIPVVAEVNPQVARYEFESGVLKLEVEAKNISGGPIQLAEFTTSTLSFVNPAVGTPEGDYETDMKLTPAGPIQPGQTQNLVIELTGDRFEEEHLLPEGESQLTIAGLLVFADASGQRSTVEMEEPLQPNYS